MKCKWLVVSIITCIILAVFVFYNDYDLLSDCKEYFDHIKLDASENMSKAINNISDLVEKTELEVKEDKDVYQSQKSEYVQQKIDEGYTFIESTEEGLLCIKSVFEYFDTSLQLCFEKDTVDIEKLREAAMTASEDIGNYYQINLISCEGHRSEYEISLNYQWHTNMEEENVVVSKVATLLPNLRGSSDYQTIRNVHNYICDNVDYCYDTLNEAADNYSAYDALISGKAVCSGYALLFQKFMAEAGIESVIAFGERDNGIGENVAHAWNLVKLDGQWYSVDCTWDGQDSKTRDKYLLQCASSFGYSDWGGIKLAEKDYK